MRIRFVEKASIGMRTKCHVASLIDNAIIWIGDNIAKK
jgi:hypothetical protein